MDVFRNDGHLSDGALESLIHNGEALDDLTRLEAAEHLAFCDQCLQRYTDLLAGTELLIPANSCQDRLWPRIRFRAIRLLTSRYATAAAAVALALTLLWGSGNLSGRVHSTAPSLLERAGTALTEWTDAWPQAWEEALSGFSGLFDNFGVSPRNDLTQGGTHP